ncbi:MAG: MBL fold metallo-hydrolase [Candidatus Kapaibacterium sp.]
MKIKFCGAAGTVTGSQHLLEINGKKILLDCGMFQGKREESFQMNRKFLFDPAEVHAVVLSHAHIDHAGNLPTLSAKGFTGFVYATPATRDLCSIMLLDSAYIQEKDIEYVNKRRAKKNQELFNPLYTVENANQIITQFKTVSYNKTFMIDGLEEMVKVTFVDAGHILGSASVVLEITENGRTFKLGFTGDLGRKDLPILRDPEFMGDVDYLITESTYGGLYHEPASKIEQGLLDTIIEALSTNGKIIVPAFSVGRTQELVYELSKMKAAGKLPEFPVYVDSPLSVNATEIFKIHPECFDEETFKLLAMGVHVFGSDSVQYIRRVEDSKKLNSVKGTAMIISASGMCEAGRILHHLANNVGNAKNTIMIIGYMGEHTLGRELIKASDKPGYVVKIFGEEHVVKARVRILNSFSAHADSGELLDYIKKFDREKLKKIFLVHGEPLQQNNLSTILNSNGFKNIVIPKRDNEFEI